MSFVILDLEFNQPTEECKKLKLEIMEIGAVRIDDNFDIIDTFKVYVKNNVYSTVNDIVKEKTGITEEDLQGGLDFPDACLAFKDWVKNDTVLHWGYIDFLVWKRNCLFYEFNETNIEFVDVQDMFRIMMELESEPSLEKAGNILHTTLNEEHNALANSFNLLNVLRSLKDHYRLNEHIEMWHKNELKLLYDAKKFLNYDRSKFTTYCPKCKGNTRRVSEYYNSFEYHILVSCDRCGRNTNFTYFLQASKIILKAKKLYEVDFRKENRRIYYNYKNLIYYKNHKTNFEFKKNIMKYINNKPKTIIDVIKRLPKIKV